jgi:single-strand DNA-binding protein
MNKVLLIGRMGHDPELQYSKAGKPYCRLRMATNQSWIGKDEKREVRTEWHSVFAWGSKAEYCAKSLRTGALVLVQGSLAHWQGTEKNETNTAVQAEDVQLLKPSVRPLELASHSAEADDTPEALDNLDGARNHNAVAHPAAVR